jgi:hypothetical protein
MAININHTNNTLSSNSGTFIFGAGIVPSIENAVYSPNFSGKYYGDGSALTGLATGSFITTGQTGAFGGAGVDLSTYITTGQTGAYAAAAGTGSFVTTAQTGVFALSADTGSFVTTAQTGVFALAANTGSFVTTAQTGVFALSANTGSFVTTAQTGVFALSANTGSFVTTAQTSVLLTGSTGFNANHQAKNVGIIAQNCFFGQEGAGNSGYLLLNKGNGNETNNLFNASPFIGSVGTFSVMLIGNGIIGGYPGTTTSMRIDGAYENGTILNQVKNIYFKTQNLNDANVVIEDDNFRIAVSGISGTMVWSSKIDILDMKGYAY